MNAEAAADVIRPPHEETPPAPPGTDEKGEEDDLFLANLAPKHVNYLDVKLHHIEGLPPDWYEGESEGPAYAQHPFRYEVTLSMPATAAATHAVEASADVRKDSQLSAKEDGDGARPLPTSAVVAAFTRGRLLSPLPQYEQYIDTAVPPPLPVMDEVGPVQDVPEALEPPTGAIGGGSNTAAADAQMHATGSLLLSTAAPGGPLAGAEMPAALPPPVVMWVATERTDAASLAAAGAATFAGNTGTGTAGGTAADKKAKKKAAAAGGSSLSGTAGGTAGSLPESAALPLPDKSEPAPCVVRVPLDAAQQAYLESLLNTQQPLNLVLRRVLRPGVPDDWEDFNAGFFQATIPVSLAPFAEPGSLHLSTTVPLRPARPEELQADGAPLPGGLGAAGSNVGGEHDRAKKKLAAKRNKNGIPAKLYEDPDPTSPHPYLAANTAAVVSLSLQRTLTRLAMDRVRPAVTPQQLIPSRAAAAPQVTPITAPPAAASASEEVAAALEDIARKILREYREGIGSDERPLPSAAATQTAKEAWRVRFLEFFQSSGQLAAYKAQLTPLVVRLVHERFAESRDATREKVSQMSNELYVYLLESMHATLRRLLDSELNGNAASPRAAVAEAASAPAPSDGVHASADPSTVEGCQSAVWRTRALEAEAAHDFALATTYHQARINSACECVEATATTATATATHCCSLPNIWAEAANFYVRVGESVKAEQCYREAIACEATHLPALLGYGMLLLSYGRLSEAAVFLHGAIDVAPQHALVWGCIALLDDLYMLDLKEGSPLFAPEKAKWEREHRYAVQQAIKALQTQSCAGKSPRGHDDRKNDLNSSTGTAATSSNVAGTAMASSASSASSPGSAPAASGKAMAEEEGEAVYLLCAHYAVQLHHHDLANVCLARCQAGSLEVELLYAQIFTQGGQHRDAVNALADMETSLQAGAMKPVARDEAEGAEEALTLIVDKLTVLRATCEEALGQTEQAIKSYKQALCKVGANGFAEVAAYLRPTNEAVSLSFDPVVDPMTLAKDGASLATEGPAHTRAFFVRAYMRLGSLLLASAQHKDALGVFALGIQVWPACSVLWLGAGVAYHRMGNPIAAEECLNESNSLNPLNPRTWAYLALHCATQGAGATTPKELEQCLQQTMLHGLADAALWAELGRELLLSARLPGLAEICLRRAMEGAAGSKDAALASTCAYHLAHALAHMSRWEEAKGMLERVVRMSRNEVLKAKAEEELLELAEVI